MDQSNDAVPEDPDEGAELGEPSQGVPLENSLPLPGESSNNVSVEIFEQPLSNAMDNPTVNMEIELARIQEGMFSPVILLNNVNNEPEVQSIIDISTDQSNDQFAMEELDSDMFIVSSRNLPPDYSPHSPRNSGRPSAEELSTSHCKKRKRIDTPERSTKPPSSAKYAEDDDGTVCSICLDEWTVTGDHRVVSLKCGHLFGMSCIKRWLQDKTAATRSCATCKAKATVRDMRFIFARSIKAVDNTEEEMLREQVEIEKKKNTELTIKLSVVQVELMHCRKMIERYKTQQQELHALPLQMGDNGLQGAAARRTSYRLFMEKNLEITRDPGCRVMAYAAKQQTLLISQKSTLPLFPGYSVRMMLVPEFSLTGGGSTLLVSSRSVRDIAIDASDDLFTCATMEKTVKIFSIQSRSVQSTITPSQDAVLWSCAFDKERSKFLYLGSQRGSVYVYDIRQPDQLLEEFRVGFENQDYTAVVKICPVEPTSVIPCGGFLVCKLKSVWFYEYKPTQQIEHHLLNITGTFSSMSYNASSGLILISARPTVDKPSTLVLATIEKSNESFVLQIQHTFEGSRVQTLMYRCAQVHLNDKDTLVASYVESSKILATWCTNNGQRSIQHLPMSESILDICPIRATPGQTYLAALSECRCRIYRLNTE
ncbi:E3 ubiquitin-protein ligase RFWD3 [Anopheles nili]|uniref:E3 ubiquitin-protein ligase RFWD3 n=1 Tax=Anopheles nili TaxID=185578 RepID=UPI00237A30F0|nr:E3 ubiquitin-protein ligase RFWD3 [Anopheles nili]